jgi:hypothetical protein
MKGLWFLARIRLANWLLDLGLIEAAKWLVPERRSFKGLLPPLGGPSLW